MNLCIKFFLHENNKNMKNTKQEKQVRNIM